MAHLDRFFSWLHSVEQFISQIIIVDDCSTDGTFSRLASETNRFQQLLVINREFNSGRPSIPRNEGIKLVTSDRLIFLDIDDLLPIKYIHFLSTTDTAFCYSGTKLVIDQVFYRQDYDCDLTKFVHLKPSRINRKNPITFSGSSLPVSIVKKYSFSNEPLEDWIYWMNISATEPLIDFIKFLDVPVYYDVSVSLSPKKGKQLRRIFGKVGMIKFVGYCAETLRLKFQEKSLKNLYFRSS